MPEDRRSPERRAAAEMADLAILTRLALGAAHTMNNAFTALLAEASFLRDERKDDPTLTEACESVTCEVERCARLTRWLLARRHPPQQGAAEIDLVRLLRALVELLHETLGRQHEIELRAPDDLLPVAASARDVERLVLGAVQFAADAAGGPSRMRLELRRSGDGRGAVLRLDVTAPGAAEDAAAACLDPSRAATPIERALLEAVAEVAAMLGGGHSAAVTAPDAWALSVRLPLVAA